MKTFKLLLLVIVLGILTITTHAQNVTKFRTSSYTYKVTDDYDTWGEWEDWKSSSNLVILDATQERLSIYTKTTQVYEFIECSSTYEDSDGDTRFDMTCVDTKGITCEITLLKFASTGKLRLFIEYSNAYIMYEIYAI